MQQPRPPLHVGGISEKHTLPLVARFADVWNVPTYGLADWEAKAEVLDQICEQIGRDPATIRWSHQAVLVLAADDAVVGRCTRAGRPSLPGPGVERRRRWLRRHARHRSSTTSARCASGASASSRSCPFDRGEGDTLDLLAEDVVPHLR